MSCPHSARVTVYPKSKSIKGSNEETERREGGSERGEEERNKVLGYSIGVARETVVVSNAINSGFKINIK